MALQVNPGAASPLLLVGGATPGGGAGGGKDSRWLTLEVR